VLPSRDPHDPARKTQKKKDSQQPPVTNWTISTIVLLCNLRQAGAVTPGCPNLSALHKGEYHQTVTTSPVLRSEDQEAQQRDRAAVQPAASRPSDARLSESDLYHICYTTSGGGVSPDSSNQFSAQKTKRHNK
jgi:hypothetical protein